MQSRKYIPRAPLSKLIGCLWYWEETSHTHKKERLLPSGEPAIIFNLRDEPIRLYDAQNLSRYSTYGLAVLSGARSDCFVIDAHQQDRVVGIQFLPGGAFPFFRMPASEGENVSINLEDLWGSRTGEIRERLLAAPTIEAILVTLESCLLEQLVRSPDLHPAVAYALRSFAESPSSSRIKAVTEQIGISPRRFIELFRREVGLSPKVFCRVRRFQQVLQVTHGRKNVDWAQVALDCGYYDQPHFIHDFQSFSGLTPSAYLAASTRHANHVPLL